MKPQVINNLDGEHVAILDFDEYAYELGQRIMDKSGSTHNDIKSLLRHLSVISNSKTMKNLFDKGEAPYVKREHSESAVSCRILSILIEGKYVDIAHLKMNCLELVKKYEACYPNSVAINIYNILRSIVLLVFLSLSGALVLCGYPMILLESAIAASAVFIALNVALSNTKNKLRALLDEASKVK